MAAITDAPLRAAGSKWCEFPVAGESFHQEAIAQALGRDVGGDVQVHMRVQLVPDPHNRADANAVEVRGRGHLMGFLPRESAAEYVKALRGAGFDGRAAECWAYVDGGPESLAPEGYYCVRLGLDWPPRFEQVGGPSSKVRAGSMVRQSNVPAWTAGGICVAILLGAWWLSRMATAEPPAAAAESTPRANAWSEARDSVQASVKSMLRDPDSATFGDVYIPDTALPIACGDVNSRNGFGGMSGPLPFVVIGTQAYVRQRTNDRDFVALWNKTCATEVGHRITTTRGARRPRPRAQRAVTVSAPVASEVGPVTIEANSPPR